MQKLKKLLIYEIFDFISKSNAKKLKSIKNRKIFQYYLARNRANAKLNREKRIRDLLQRKKDYDERIRISELKNKVTRLSDVVMMRRMLIFRSGKVDVTYVPPHSFEYENDLNKVRDLVKLNKDDIVGLKHSRKEINGAFLPEIIYKTDSKIKISKEELIKIFKQENKLRMAEITMTRNDYFSGLKLMSEIDQDHIEEALEIVGYDPQNDDSLKAYHLACSQYMNDPEMKERVLWMKYDKMRSMSVEINQEPIVEGITLYDLNAQPFQLKDLIIKDVPNLIVCGSYS